MSFTRKISCFFHKGTYLESLRRMKVISIIALVLNVVYGYAVAFLASLNGRGLFWSGSRVYVIGLGDCQLAITISAGIGIPILALVLFHFLNKRKDSDFYHAIPVKRSTMIISGILAVLTVYLVTTMVFLLVLSVSAILMANSMIHLDTVLLAFLYAIFAAFVVGGIAMLSVSLSGNTFVGLILMVIIAITVRLFAYICIITFESLTSNVPINTLTEFLLRTSIFSWNSVDKTMTVTTFVWALVESLVYYALATILFVRRKSEMAGAPIISRGVQAAARIAVSFLVSLAGTGIVLQLMVQSAEIDNFIDNYYYAVIWYVVAIVVYFVFELITTRKWECVKKSIATLPIVVALNIIFIVGMNMGVNKYNSRVISPDKIKYIELSDDHSKDYYKGVLALDSSNARFDNPVLIRKVCEVLNKEIDYNLYYDNVWTYFEFKFVEKNTSYIRRFRVDAQMLRVMEAENLSEISNFEAFFSSNEGPWFAEMTVPAGKSIESKSFEKYRAELLKFSETERMEALAVEEAFAVAQFKGKTGVPVHYPVSYKTPDSYQYFVGKVINGSERYFVGDFDTVYKKLKAARTDKQYNDAVYVAIDTPDIKKSKAKYYYDNEDYGLFLETLKNMEYEDITGYEGTVAAVKIETDDGLVGFCTFKLTPSQVDEILNLIEKM